MKKTIIAALAVALTFASCAKEKKFTRSNGTQFAAKPYGWATKEDKIKGVEYKVCTSNLILSAVFSETIAIPLVVTGTELWEPVSYTEPQTTK